MISTITDKTLVLSTAEADRWNHILTSFPVALQDIHLTPAYHQLYEKNGDGEARLFVYSSKDNIYINSHLIRPVDAQWAGAGYFDIETPYGYGGPVSTTEDKAFLLQATNAFSDYCKEQKIISEFVRFHPLLRNYRFVPAGGRMKVIPLRDYLTVNLQQSKEELEMKYLPKNRTVLRKAEKEGVHVIEDKATTQFDTFKNIYLSKMSELGATSTYFFSEPYFRELRKLIQRHGRLLIAIGPQGVEGGAVFLYMGNWAHYFLAAVTNEGRKHGAGNLLLHEGINWARTQGATLMHIGGGVTADPKDPLLLFKQCFTSDQVPFHIGKSIHNEEVYREACDKWDRHFAPHAEKFSAILQRYHFKEKDLLG